MWRGWGGGGLRKLWFYDVYLVFINGYAGDFTSQTLDSESAYVGYALANSVKRWFIEERTRVRIPTNALHFFLIIVLVSVANGAQHEARHILVA